MKLNIIRKIVIALIFITPVFSYTGCKKQAKCGCGKDVLYTLTNAASYIYWDTEASIQFQTVGNPSSMFYFCNPSEMLPKLAEVKSGDVLLVSGEVYYNCQYLYQASNSYYSYGRMMGYDVHVTGLTVDLYGKNRPASETAINPADSKK